MSDTVHVAAAVIRNPQGQVLICRRHAQAHQGGLWEFPGGKIEAGEDVYSALCRELHEELGITVTAARPLIRIPHQYPDKHVLLDVWQVDAFSGTAHGREAQPLVWVAPARLGDYDFPAANRAIVTAAQLPEYYLITPEPEPDFLARLDAALARGIRLLQLRAKGLDANTYRELAEKVCARAAACSAQVLLNGDPELVQAVGAAGVHLDSRRLTQLTQRPLPAGKLVAASCHDAAQLQQAARIGADFVVLSPVLPTASHPGAAHLGWDGLQALCADVALPVYALGGMRGSHVQQAWQAGAQGIAAISGLWNDAR